MIAKPHCWFGTLPHGQLGPIPQVCCTQYWRAVITLSAIPARMPQGHSGPHGIACQGGFTEATIRDTANKRTQHPPGRQASPTLRARGKNSAHKTWQGTTPDTRRPTVRRNTLPARTRGWGPERRASADASNSRRGEDQRSWMTSHPDVTHPRAKVAVL